MMEIICGKCALKLHPISAFVFLILCTGLLLLYEEGYQRDILANSPKHIPGPSDQFIYSNSNGKQGSEVVTMQTRKSSSVRKVKPLNTTMKSTKQAPIVSSKAASKSLVKGVLTMTPVMHECLNAKAPPNDNYLRDALLLGKLPSKTEMCVMSVAHLDTLLQAYMNTIQILCGSSMVRMGARRDGGWDVCPNARYLQKDNCLVYSFGINNDFSFDDAIARDYGCKVHSFDPSMKKSDHIRSQKPFVSFHATGLSNFNGTSSDRHRWKMRTLSGIRHELGHKVMPDVLKMDIEFSEWNALPDILHKTPVNQLPKQLIAEFHYFVFKTDLKTHWLKVLFTFRDLYEVGYRIAWISRNIDVNCIKKSKSTGAMYYLCHEVTFLKENIA
ncbi:probable methyltransferase-like protein 24 [Ylistrum balloti]|uniref:probable methyltransferase-like protein 24 n=1 Tax=Ylistrum balloti TaxID=509963 RepID=UPI002905B225|nr:probable methyltransferase-like protein 24 [Ylistrum balloti]